MGGVFNYANLNVYHYGGQNPLMYIDPSGTDIVHLGLLGLGVKIIGGAGVQFGIAWDDNGRVTGYTTLSAGVGVEATLDTPVSMSYSRTIGKNISDLQSVLGGLYRFDTGTTATAGALLGGIIFDMDTEEIVGGNVLAVGGGVSKELTLYFDLPTAIEIIKNSSDEVRNAFTEAVRGMGEDVPPGLEAVVNDLEPEN